MKNENQKQIGRPVLLTAETMAVGNRMIQAGLSKTQIARLLGIHRSSVYRLLVGGKSHG